LNQKFVSKGLKLFDSNSNLLNQISKLILQPIAPNYITWPTSAFDSLIYSCFLTRTDIEDSLADMALRPSPARLGLSSSSRRPGQPPTAVFQLHRHRPCATVPHVLPAPLEVETSCLCFISPKRLPSCLPSPVSLRLCITDAFNGCHQHRRRPSPCRPPSAPIKGAIILSSSPSSASSLLIDRPFPSPAHHGEPQALTTPF
jgi:hypothetical protein